MAFIAKGSFASPSYPFASGAHERWDHPGKPGRNPDGNGTNYYLLIAGARKALVWGRPPQGPFARIEYSLPAAKEEISTIVVSDLVLAGREPV
jgi:hypothetical protein